MDTAIDLMWTINLEASSLLLQTTSTEKSSYLFNKFLLIVTNSSTIYTEVVFVSSPHYSCFLNEFSDIITTPVLAVAIPHAQATT